jgi:hypothetical protein
MISQMAPPHLTHLEAIRDEVRQLRMADLGVVRQLSILGGAVNIGLRSDGESLAAQLHERFGGDVRVTLGLFPYPRDRTPTSEERHVVEVWRNRPVDEAISIPGLEATLELAENAVVAGQDGAGRVILRNVGRTKVNFSSDRPLIGAVTDPVSGESIGGYFGGIGGTGQGVRLSPGEEQVIDMIFGTASWDLQRGYALPPGRYLVTTGIPVLDSPGTTGPRREYLIVTPADLTIIGA